MKETEKALELLEQQIDDMHKKLKGHESLSIYEAILSPARMITIDILHHIFYHCIPTQRHPIMSSYEAPMVLTQVCSTWRAVAFSSPRLWSKIRISFAYSSKSDPDRDSISDLDPEVSAIDGDTILRMRGDAVKEWLDRSGSCPISISIHHTGMNARRTVKPDESSVVNTLELFKTIVALSDRWEEIELIVSKQVYSLLEPMIPINNLSLLKTARILFGDHYPIQEREWNGPGSTSLKAPNI